MRTIWFIIGIIIIYATIKTVAMIFDEKRRNKQKNPALTFITFIVGGIIIISIIYFVDHLNSSM